MHNAIKRGLAAGRAQIGIHSRLPSPYVTEIVAGAGFDWMLIDTEHSPNDLESVLLQLQAIAPYPTSAIVHLPANDPVTIKRLLDIGVQTVLVPNVCSAQEAEAAASYVQYPPRGVRGLANLTRASAFGRVKDYAQNAHEDICLFVMIETREGLENLEAIARVDGVDGVFIGPADLHASMGHAGQTDHPDVKNAIDDALRRIAAAGKAPGVIAGAEADARRWIGAGARMVCVGSDIRLLARGADALARTFLGD